MAWEPDQTSCYFCLIFLDGILVIFVQPLSISQFFIVVTSKINLFCGFNSELFDVHHVTCFASIHFASICRQSTSAYCLVQMFCCQHSRCFVSFNNCLYCQSMNAFITLLVLIWKCVEIHPAMLGISSGWT